MKLIDKVIRYWRTKVALNYSPQKMQSVLDIGCDDGYLLKRLDSSAKRKEGVDPKLSENVSLAGIKLWSGYFPGVIKQHQIQGSYDAIFALAVFEHFSDDDLISSAQEINNILSSKGKLIITVPHPFVDKILDVLLFLRVIDGQAVEEHHGFEPEQLKNVFNKHLVLLEHKKFQFGLNNIFVFVRK